MATLPRKRNQVDPIGYIIRRRFPWAIGYPTKQQNEAIQQFRCELEAIAPAELAKLVQTEEQREAEEKKARLVREESERFFNLPSSAAHYDHFCRLPYWTLDECVALSLGKNPKIVNWKTVGPLVSVSPFAANYADLREVTQRAKWAKQLFEPVSPSVFLAWAKETCFPVSEELKKRSVNAGVSLAGWRQLYEEQQAIAEKALHDFGAAQQQVAELKKEISELRTAAAIQPKQSFATRERQTMLKLIIGLACGGYGYNPSALRNPATAEIKRDLETIVGIRLDEDTIRKYLREATEFIDTAQLTELRAKPNSPKR